MDSRHGSAILHHEEEYQSPFIRGEDGCLGLPSLQRSVPRPDRHLPSEAGRSWASFPSEHRWGPTTYLLSSWFGQNDTPSIDCPPGLTQL